MIGALLTRITGLFNKSFLFSSFLPALLFCIVVSVVLAGVAGLEPLALWVDSLTGTKKAALTLACLALLISFAYVLNALRPTFRGWWSGDLGFVLLFFLKWLVLIGMVLQRMRYQRLMREKTMAGSFWKSMWNSFMNEAERNWESSTKCADPAEIRKLQRRIAKLNKYMSPEKANEQVSLIADAFKRCSGESLGKEVYMPLKQKMKELHEVDEAHLRTILVRLDTEFGDFSSVRATRLGNIIESYYQYASTRYNIEMEVFSTHLRNILPQKILDSMDDQQTLLDFAVTTATLSALLAVLSLLFGPWLWYRPFLWITVATVGWAAAALGYQLSIKAASALGALWKAACDLYRLDLMEALQRPRPLSLVAERKQWSELSKLAVYADRSDFLLRQSSQQSSANATPHDSASASPEI